MPAERAAALVAETRAHVAAADTSPRQEFPSLDHYARDLAEGEPVRQGPWWRSRTARLLVQVCLPVLLLPAVVGALLDGELWIGLGGIAVVLWLGWEALRSVQAHLQARRTGQDRSVRRQPTLAA